MNKTTTTTTTTPFCQQSRKKRAGPTVGSRHILISPKLDLNLNGCIRNPQCYQLSQPYLLLKSDREKNILASQGNKLNKKILSLKVIKISMLVFVLLFALIYHCDADTFCIEMTAIYTFFQYS